MIIRTFYSTANINRHIRTSSTNCQLQRILLINMNSQENLYHVTFVIDSSSHHPSLMPVLFFLSLNFIYCLVFFFVPVEIAQKLEKRTTKWTWADDYSNISMHHRTQSIDRSMLSIECIAASIFFTFCIFSSFVPMLLIYLFIFSINFCLTR